MAKSFVIFRFYDRRLLLPLLFYFRCKVIIESHSRKIWVDKNYAITSIWKFGSRYKHLEGTTASRILLVLIVWFSI